jgi:hypothetical protein
VAGLQAGIVVMTDITKEQFKIIVEQMVNELISLPDDLWESSFASANISLSNDQTIFVGIRGDEDK